MCYYVLSFELWCPLRFPQKNDVRFVFTSGCLKEGAYFRLFEGGSMSYLRYLCLFVYSDVQHILCCVFVLCFFVLCTLTLDCPFFIAPSVLSNVDWHDKDQSFQLKLTERLENRLSSKTIKVVLSNRKLTGRKRIAFDNNVHKIAIFSDELEYVKQLNFSLQKFESDNIEFEKKVFWFT